MTVLYTSLPSGAWQGVTPQYLYLFSDLIHMAIPPLIEHSREHEVHLDQGCTARLGVGRCSQKEKKKEKSKKSKESHVHACS